MDIYDLPFAIDDMAGQAPLGSGARAVLNRVYRILTMDNDGTERDFLRIIAIARDYVARYADLPNANPAVIAAYSMLRDWKGFTMPTRKTPFELDPHCLLTSEASDVLQHMTDHHSHHGDVAALVSAVTADDIEGARGNANEYDDDDDIRMSIVHDGLHDQYGEDH